MDALKFLREVQRMHNYYTSIYHDCLKCPMADMPCRIPVTDWGDSVLNTCVERVEQWSKEHPQKTRLTDILEKFPKVEIDNHGLPNLCCAKLGYACSCLKSTCRDCWNTPLEDDE